MAGLISTLNEVGTKLFSLENSDNQHIEILTYSNYSMVFKTVDQLIFCYLFIGQSYIYQK